MSNRQLKASSSTQRNGSFQPRTDNRDNTRLTSTFPHSNHQESWAAVLTSVIAILLTLRRRFARTSRETAGLRHYHDHYVLALSNN